MCIVQLYKFVKTDNMKWVTSHPKLVYRNLHVIQQYSGKQPVWHYDEINSHRTTQINNQLILLRSPSQLQLYQSETRINFQSKAFWSRHQLSGKHSDHDTSCLELSVSSYKKFRYHHHFQGTSENWTVRSCIPHGL